MHKILITSLADVFETVVFYELMLDAGYWMLDAGCWILDTGCWITKNAPTVNSKNIQYPVTRIKDQSILVLVSIAAARFIFDFLCN